MIAKPPRYIYSSTPTIKFVSSSNHDFEQNYYYTYSFYYKWLCVQENSLLSYSIKKNHELILTSQKLYIKKPKTQHEIYFRDIDMVSFSYKKLLLPLLVGGIVTPLMFVLMFQNGLNTWWAMGIAFGGLLSLYYGWRGMYQLQIQAKHKIHTFFIGEDSVSLQNLLAILHLKTQHNT